MLIDAQLLATYMILNHLLQSRFSSAEKSEAMAHTSISSHDLASIQQLLSRPYVVAQDNLEATFSCVCDVGLLHFVPEKLMIELDLTAIRHHHYSVELD